MVSLQVVSTNKRYWISHVWVEAEPVANGIKAPNDRDYFHRYKLRFDRIESQGPPWWDTYTVGDGPALDPLGTVRESSGSKSRGPPTLVDPISGLATPPITPPKRDNAHLSTYSRTVEDSPGLPCTPLSEVKEHDANGTARTGIDPSSEVTEGSPIVASSADRVESL